MDAEPPIPWSRVAAFVRQHTHDVRNGLNSLDLEISLLRELAAEGEIQECVERVRKQARNVAEQMRSLSSLFQDPQPIAAPIAVSELVLIWREENAAMPNAREIQWVNDVGGEKVKVDAGMMANIFRALSSNAVAFSEGGTVTMTARREANDIVFELREPKTSTLDPSEWGRLFSTTRRGGYGTGLWQARRLAVANGATLTQHFSPEESELITRIVAPVV